MQEVVITSTRHLKTIYYPSRWDFWALSFILAHLICWTLAPILVRFNLPLDSIEGSLWGHQLEWGYDKNPFLNAWLTALAIALGGSSGWMVYLFSQLSVGVCFFAIWKLSKKMLPEGHALIALLLLEGVQYFHFHAIDFNDNTLELGLWALCIYFFYQALRQRQNLAWVLTGTFAGLGMMAKYYTAALIATMFLYMFFNSENRKQLKTFQPYLGMLAFILIITPHVIWLCAHQFITIMYVFERGSSEPALTNHFFFPLQFIWQQLEVFIPALILAIPLLFKQCNTPQQSISLTQFDKSFLFCIGLGPLILTALLSLFFGIKLRAGWGMPLLSTWGIMLIVLLKPTLTNKKIYLYIVCIFTFMALLLTAYSLSLIRCTTPSSANFPGKEIANKITNLWHTKYHSKLHYVAGSRWLGGNISLYSKDHPAIFMEWNNNRSPWINDYDLENKGAVFIWDISDKESMPKEIKKRYPKLLASSEMEFAFQRNYHQLSPVKIGIALLPPKEFP